jgi:hypothetical protein
MSTFVERLAQMIVQDNAVLFVGAGLRQGGDQPPAVQHIAEALAERIQYQRPDRSLPAVARDFEVLRGRQALVLALREELDKLSVDRPLPIYQLIADAVLPRTKILTTRFDHALEQALEQFHKPYVLIVRDTDVPFFDESKVSLIKMLGDIGQPDSLVITEDDIDAFISKLPTVSDVVRAFFATKTLVFLGYDLSGEQFKRIFRQVTRNLSIFRRQAYAILPQPLDEVEVRYWREQSVEVHVQAPLGFLEELAGAVKAAVKTAPPRARSLAGIVTPALPPRPYKGLDSFSGADEAIFTGRLEESYRLTNRILAHRLTVLYGESGSGKTSLLQAGAGPRLARNRALLVTCAPAPGQSLPETLRRRLLDAGREAGLPEPDADELPAIVQAWQGALDGPLVLGIDQFEGFFLAYSPSERQAALNVLNGWLNDRSLDLRLVLVVREDFLGRLQSLEESMPGLLDVRFRLERLGREAARAAIEEPARLFNIAWEPALVQTLLDDLYAADQGGVAPPQLQIVCDQLYQALIEQAGGPAGERGAAPPLGQGLTQITLAGFQALGGTPAILGRYLDRAVLSFPADQQPQVRALLGALVSSSGVKQRLALGDLARAAEVAPEAAAPILDELTRQRLVRRYELKAEGADGVGVEYDLVHDYLVAHIARWLGDDFWAAQRAREILRQALPEWHSRARLLAPDDLRLIAAQRGRMRFSEAEAELLYAAAASYDQQPADWQAPLSETARQRILLGLAGHPEALVRRQAVRQLAPFPGLEVSAALAGAALGDPDPQVRQSAAHAIARPDPAGAGQDGKLVDREAVAHLVAASADAARRDVALQALVAVRDLQPASHPLLPQDLRGPLLRRVWAARWGRNRDQILRATLRGVQGGFWGLGLGMGLFLGPNDAFASGFDRISWPALARLMSIGIPVAGVMGVFGAGSAAFAGAALRSLADREERWRTWAAATLAGGIGLGLAFLLFSSVFLGQPQPLRSMAAGLLVGLGLTGVATAPLRAPRLLRLGLAALAGMAAFGLAWSMGLIFNRSSFAWLLLMGGASGVGFCLGLNPGRQEVRQ